MILTEAGFDFDVKIINVEEIFPDNMKAMEVARFIAEKKAKQVPFLKNNEILMTADTTVVLNDIILGKPEDRDDAFTMLGSLSGKMHAVVSGVCIKNNKNVVSFSDTTYVWFKPLSDEEIEYYVDEFQPYDKAGAYGIQDWIGMIGVTKIEGSYFNVMGLPIHKIYDEMGKFLTA